MSVFGPVVTMDRVIRDGLEQATTTTDIWMRERYAAQLHYTAVGDVDKAALMQTKATEQSALGADWLASFEKYFGPPAPTGIFEEYTVTMSGSGEFRRGTAGSIVPPGGWFRGIEIERLFTQVGGNIPFTDSLSVAMRGANVPQALFKEVSLLGITDPAWGGGEQTYPSATPRDYLADLANNTYWIWDYAAPFVGANQYRLRMSYPDNTIETTHVVTAGASGLLSGFSTYGNVAGGSIDNATTFDSEALTRVAHTTSDNLFRLSIGSTDLLQSFFSDVTIEGITDPAWGGGRRSFNTDLASPFIPNELGSTAWFWLFSTSFVTGHQYAITMRRVP